MQLPPWLMGWLVLHHHIIYTTTLKQLAKLTRQICLDNGDHIITFHNLSKNIFANLEQSDVAAESIVKNIYSPF